MTAIQTVEHETTKLIPADPMVSMIERVAMDPNADLDKLERMLQLKEQHDQRQAKAQYAEAFAAAAASFPTIPLRGKGHNGKPYATLEDITKFTRPVLSEHGLVLSFACAVGDQITVTAKLTHAAGHSEQTSMELPRDTSGSKNAVQAVGSTQKYGQRYTAQAILGLSLGEDDEDDGRAAGRSTETLSAEQFIEIRGLAEVAGVSEDVICKAEGVTELHELPSRKFSHVTSMLKTNIANKSGEQAG